jgi:hypothetical protein
VEQFIDLCLSLKLLLRLLQDSFSENTNIDFGKLPC